MRDAESDELMILRCRSCGDTFTVHAGEDPLCPSCGGTDHDIAHEPLL